MALSIIFTVTGTGEFPFDMLRYDRCFPEDSESAGAMNTPLMRDYSKPRSVTLRRDNVSKNTRPTRDRWSSFGWTVGSVDEARS